ncbi:hypothetical protein ET495_12185 [Xylanimonas allomyrinae]|uniref:D-alanyl-D-alanine carboxypeptidase-like core domain-containing protein n=1 Tax=Xylanimonas allomyrinae TaxID=2509459 RepID=A0A4P6F0K4_9MICO|nr:M15 family metallopeptidase [Xylanimonas allomyrinae]QAY63868.1 hypothetical protein ET495_12185 [Xylanimonas allomyrinae]
MGARRRRAGMARLTRVTIASVVVVVLVVGACAVVTHRRGISRQLDEVTAQTAQAQAAERALVARLADEITTAKSLFTSSEGAVADDGVRDGLAGAIEAAEKEKADAKGVVHGASLTAARAALRAANAEVAHAKGAEAALRAAIDAVRASHAGYLLDEATKAASAAKLALDASIEAADKTLTESEGKVGDDSVRRALKDALDAARQNRDHAVDASSADALGAAAKEFAAAQAALDAAAHVVSEAVSAKAAADEAARAAADRASATAGGSSAGATPGGSATGSAAAAGSAPVSGRELCAKYGNGRIPASALVQVPWAPTVTWIEPAHPMLLAPSAFAGLERLNEAFSGAFGMSLPLDDAYRSYEDQVDAKAQQGDWAAKPGTSNHGCGIAIDVPDYRYGHEDFGPDGEKYHWLVANARQFGWATGRVAGEPWHLEFVG